MLVKALNEFNIPLPSDALKVAALQQDEELKAKHKQEQEELKAKQEQEKEKEKIKQQRKEKKILNQEQKQQKILAQQTLKELDYQRQEEKRIVENEERLRIANQEYKILKEKQKQEKEELKIKQEQDKLKQEQELLKSSDVVKNVLQKKALQNKIKLELKELRLKQKQEQFAIKFKEQKQSKAIGELQAKYKKFKEINKETYDMYYYEKENIEDDYDNRIKIKNAAIAKYEQEIKDNTLSTLGSVGSLFQSKEETQKRKDKIKTANDFIKKLKAEIKDLQFLKKVKLTKEKEKLNARLKVASGVVQSSKVFNMKILRTLKTNVKLNDKQRKEYLKKESDEIDAINKSSNEQIDKNRNETDIKITRVIYTYKDKIDDLTAKIKEEEKSMKDYAPSSLDLFLSKDKKDDKKRKYESSIKYIKYFQRKLDNELQQQKEEIDRLNDDKLKSLKGIEDEATKGITKIRDRYKLILDKVSRNDMIETDKLIKQQEEEEKRLVRKEEEKIAKEVRIRLAEQQRLLDEKRREEETIAKEERRVKQEEEKIAREQERARKEKEKEEQRIKKEQEEREWRIRMEKEAKAKHWAKFDKLKEEILPLIQKLKNLYEQRQTIDISDLSKLKKINKNMYDMYMSILRFKTKYNEKEWSKIAYNDLSDWDELLNQVKIITSSDYKIINQEKIKEEERIAKEKERIAKARYDEQTRKNIEEDEKRRQLQAELKAREKENAEIVAKALLEAKNENQKNVAILKSFVEKMTLIENSFLKDPNNMQTLEKNIEKFKIIINDYYTFKATLNKDELQKTLIEWGISNDDLKLFEKQMAIKNEEWEKLIADKQH